MTAKKTEKKQSFEQALARLEAVVKEMEAGSLSLEKMTAHFEEGQTLVKFCAAKLDEVEKKIEVLVKKDGNVNAEPFDPDEDTESAAAAAADAASAATELF